MRPISVLSGFIALLAGLAACAATPSAPPPTGPIGLDYEDGNGMDQLNCDSGNGAQVATDMRELATLKPDWVRIDASMTETSGLPKPPTCSKQPEFRGLETLLDGIAKTGARPLVNILGNRYEPSAREPYLAWLERLLDKVPHNSAFEIGNEENLAKSTEGYKGAPDGDYPYGWTFDNRDFDQNDRIGHCPRDPAKMADLDKAAGAYVAWLADSYAAIKKKRPEATVVAGGLASWQFQCWAQMLGRHQAYLHADAMAFHPYGDTPTKSAESFDAFRAIVENWPKKLPIWITEFGFTTTQGNGSAVSNETVKAEDLIENYRLLAARTRAPILYYTARDWPLTTADWKKQCGYVPCLPVHPDSAAARIPGTDKAASGAGLFEWIDGKLAELPAAQAFRKIRAERKD